MKPVGYLNHKPWAAEEALGLFIHKLAKKGITLRFVGGAVRDAITEDFDTQFDIDLAVDITPDEMIALCLELEVQVIPTGLKYGTVTCVLDKKSYEVTSLRKDIKTDGRRGVVSYTKDWHEDALRRDLTINALYADWDGGYYDPTGLGIQDLQNRYLRFIGDPEQRIKEDFLRIVRFFRFMALFPKATYDNDAFDACLRLGHHLHIISLERKWNEIQKIFKSNFPVNTIEALISSKLMIEICRVNWSLNKLERSIDWVKHQFNDNIYYGILGAVNHFQIDRSTCIPIGIQKRLDEVFRVKIQPKITLKELYQHGKDVYKDAYIRHLITTKNFSDTALKEYCSTVSEIEKKELPRFPVSGGNLQTLGFTPGPVIGEILKETEQWWIDQDFSPDYEGCINHIQQLHLIKLRDSI
jgi:poly(A) polymerase